MKKQVAVMGSTGSIGRQTLSVIDAHPTRFSVAVLTACTAADRLIEQALTYRPHTVVIADERYYDKIQKALAGTGIEAHAGVSALAAAAQLPEVDVVMMALVGYAGLLPTLKAIEAGKTIALANKEALVVAGELVMRLAAKKRVAVYPVDSEHSAIFQCLAGERNNPVEKIILTASGGPFRGKTRSELAEVTCSQALKHPNWSMGKKITIDSATLMNKGLEVIEARWLFDVKPDQIEVLVHPQSIIHSMVQFRDGSIKAQLGVPDMRIPIQFAIAYPYRLHSDVERFRFDGSLAFTFEQPDTKTFRNLALAFEALQKGGNMPCVLNAANEVAVAGFLEGRIGFLAIPQIVEKCMEKAHFEPSPTYEEYTHIDREARARALEISNMYN